jgi:hypothetical protein
MATPYTRRVTLSDKLTVIIDKYLYFAANGDMIEFQLSAFGLICCTKHNVYIEKKIGSRQQGSKVKRFFYGWTLQVPRFKSVKLHQDELNNPLTDERISY